MAKSKVCLIPDCSKPPKGRGYCAGHYHRLMRHGDPLGGGPAHTPALDKCSVHGCNEPYVAKGYCATHYYRNKTYGDPKAGREQYQRGTPCRALGCDEPSRNFGYCTKHHHRYLRHGDPLAGGTYHGEPLQWLRDHMNYSGDECLNWPFWHNQDGYAYITIERHNIAAAAIMCELINGKKQTPAHEVCHNCGRGNDGCVNPNHLRWDTRSGNMADKLIHGTDHRGEKHPQSFLTTEKVLKIRALKGILPQRIVAEMFGISQSYVSALQLNKRWHWLETPAEEYLPLQLELI